MAQVTIFTPTYNKPELFAQCAESVLSQTYQDWVWWIVFNRTDWPNDYKWDYYHDPRVLPIWYPVDEGLRSISYAPSAITNWLYPKIQTPYIYVLCDDDLIDKHGLGRLVDAIRPEDWGHNDCEVCEQGYEAVYGRVEVQNEQPDGTFTTSCWCYEGTDVGLGTGISPDCRLDSGSILHTKALWDKATADGWQMPTALDSAPHVDGILLDRLAQFATFHYVPQRIAVHRRTRQSTWHKPQGT